REPRVAAREADVGGEGRRPQLGAGKGLLRPGLLVLLRPWRLAPRRDGDQNRKDHHDLADVSSTHRSTTPCPAPEDARLKFSASGTGRSGPLDRSPTTYGDASRPALRK